MKNLLLSILFLPSLLLASPTATFWSDSYDAGDGICRCDSSYDHGINNTQWETPCGTKSVPEICNLIQQKYGNGPNGNRTYYNTVQCGHPPLNNVADETDCPGIPNNTSGTWSGPRCNESGSLWPLAGICETDAGLSCSESAFGSFASLCVALGDQAQPDQIADWLKVLLALGMLGVLFGGGAAVIELERKIS